MKKSWFEEKVKLEDGVSVSVGKPINSNTMTPQEINKYLAEKIGWKLARLHQRSHLSNPEFWHLPDKSVLSQGSADFSHDIGACFKWLVPWLVQKGLIDVHTSFVLDSAGINFIVKFIFDDSAYESEWLEDPAKAFCAAMVEYFKERK